MKRNVLADRKKPTYVSDLTDDSIVGIVCNNGVKLVVVKKNDKEFVGLNNNKLDISSTWSADTLQNFVRQIRNAKQTFIFDTNIEALKWLAKKQIK
jgi:hypothetical protein